MAAPLQDDTKRHLTIAGNSAAQAGEFDVAALSKALVSNQQAIIEELFALRDQWPIVGGSARSDSAENAAQSARNLIDVTSDDLKALARAMVAVSTSLCLELAELSALWAVSVPLADSRWGDSASSGLVALVGGGSPPYSYIQRTLAAGSGKITIANGDGESGNPTIDIDVAVLEALIDHTAILNIGSLTHAQLDLKMRILDGAIKETIDINVAEAAGTVVLTLDDADGGETLTVQLEGQDLTIDVSVSRGLELGTNASPKLNYVYLVASGEAAILRSSTVSWPSSAHAPIAKVNVPSAARVASDGCSSVHAWTDHIFKTNENGHLYHVNQILRERGAVWKSGCAASFTSVTPASAVHLAIETGVVFQLHEHTMPAIDMATPTNAFVVNHATPYFALSTLTDLSVDASGNSLSGKYFSIILAGVISEKAVDCQLYLNLPTSVYAVESEAIADTLGSSVYTMPSNFKGVVFLIARVTLKKASGNGDWTLSQIEDLRGKVPSTSAGGVTASDHGSLGGLEDAADHAYAFLHDCSRALDGILTPDGDGTRDIGLTGTRFKEAFIDDLDVTTDIKVGGALAVDTIDEKTADAGVTIETVPIKDGLVDGVDIPLLAISVVLKSAYGAQTILQATSNDAPTPLTVAEQRVVGRITGGNIVGLTPDQLQTLINAGTTDVGVGNIPARFKKRTAVFELNSPAVDNEYLMIRTHQDTPITITAVGGEVGDGTSATFQVEQHAAGQMKAGGTSIDVLSSPLAFTTAGASSSSFNDATVPASTWLKFKCTAVSGSPAIAWGWIEYTVDDS